MDRFGVMLNEEYTGKLDTILAYLDWEVSPEQIILLAIDTMYNKVKND